MYLTFGPKEFKIKYDSRPVYCSKLYGNCKEDPLQLFKGQVFWESHTISKKSPYLFDITCLGHLILKYLYDIFSFLRKTNQNRSTWGIIVVMSNLFVYFLEETLPWKNHFDFVWPLAGVVKLSKFNLSIDRMDYT